MIPWSPRSPEDFSDINATTYGALLTNGPKDTPETDGLYFGMSLCMGSVTHV